MRSHAKASTAGSTQRQAKGLGAIFGGAFAGRGASFRVKGSSAPKNGLLALALCTGLLASLAFGASSAAASKVHNFKEVLGSAEVAAINEGRNVAIDQSNGDVLVMDENGPRIRRFKPNGTPDNFSALGTNVIDGEGGADATPQGKLSIGPSRESQIAVDNSGGATDGDIYVTHGFPNLIDIFSETGAYLGQLSESSGGSFSEACGVAVDSSGAVYVGDYSGGIHKFVPSANPPVNTDNTANFTTTTNPCTLAAGAGPTAGFLFAAEYNGAVSKIDSSTGELKYTVVSGEHTTVGVDPANGHVFAATGSTLEEFDASGAASATELSATKNTEPIRGIGVRGSSGEIYLTGQTNVKIYDDPIVTVPDTLTTAATGNTGTHATLNGTVNPDGVELSECFFEYGKTFLYGQSIPCAESPATIGTGTSPVSVHADLSHLTPQDTNYHFRLIAKNAQGPSQAPNDEQFNTPNTVFTETASGIADTEATLNGSVNPDGVAMTECAFEWGLTTEYDNTAPCIPNAAGIGTGTSLIAVHADLSGLHPGTVYHYRLKAANADGPISPAADMTLQSNGPMILDSWAEDVLTTEATLKAEINPEGEPTTYRFEYGPTEAYGSESGELNVASDSSVHTVFLALTNLQPGTEYHYRIIATSAAGENVGPDHAIRTFRPFSAETDCPNQANRYGAGASLPDCRAYELVSPLDKNGGDIASRSNGDYVNDAGAASRTQSTPSADKLAYGSYRAFAGAQSVPWGSEYIAQRVPGEGWQTHSINEPGGAPLTSGGAAQRTQFELLSKDLCHAWLFNIFDSPQYEGLAGARNVYRREDGLCGPERFQPLAAIVTPAAGGSAETWILGASADGSHTIFVTSSKLTSEGTEGTALTPNYQLYESPEPGVPPRLVCILPNGEAWTRGCTAGSVRHGVRYESSIEGAISEDGERIFWQDSASDEGRQYVRIGGAGTIAASQAAEEEAGTASSFFWGAAADGSRAVYTTGDKQGGAADLFAFDVDSEATEPIAEQAYGVVGISKDARRVYFLSREARPGSGQNSEGDEAVAGQPNLYFYDADSGTYAFIGTLASEDADPNSFTLVAERPVVHLARVTPDGLHLAFASRASLTGYDNKKLASSASSVPFNSLAYVYDAESGKLICASCNPSGARGPTTDPLSVPTIEGFERFLPIPGREFMQQPSRILSDDGSRLIFQTSDALDPRDSNGKVDIYEWEQAGKGGCEASDPRFAPSATGCIYLISSGTSEDDTRFAEASPSGDDVFFYTKSSLIPSDYGLRDIYDARVGGGFPLPPEAPECVGDACQSVPSAPNDPTPASAAFRGAGNLAPRKAHKRRCRARNRHAGKRAKRHAKRKAAKSCRRAKRRAGR